MAESKNKFAGFVGPAYTSRAARMDAQRLVNMYIEVDELNTGKGNQPAVLIGTPGLLKVQSIGNGPIRCTYTQSNIVISYIVSGNQIYTITGANAIPVLIPGLLMTSYGPVQMSDNGTQVIIVDGQYGYYIDTSATTPTITQITSPNFHPTDTITFQDGYFIGTQKGTSYMFISDLYSINFLPLNESNTGQSDILIAAISVSRQLYMLGAKSLQIWWDSGASGSNPFQPQQGRYSQVGCAAANSVVVLGETMFWLGSNEQGGGIVYTLQNSMPQRISNHAVEFAIQQYDDLSGATAYAYQQEGHYFYVLNIPSSETTWVFDTDSGQWHERQSVVAGATTRHIGQTHCLLNGQHIVGDYSNSNIYVYDLDTYTDNGQTINRVRQSPHFAISLNRIFYKLLEIDLQFGVGLSNTNVGGTPSPGSNPRIVLQISNDGGATFGNPIYATMGAIGKYYTRARWQRLGSSRDRVFRVTISEPVRTQMLSAYLDFEEGAA